ncbi:MAG: hypothetical protein BWY52_01243 [Chloroflexi bacterium ADurb.Bin325]|nr:MAG: hypothetical protein BWY52_01243 [Chloroflexi bacterium ADurb.Bin325]
MAFLVLMRRATPASSRRPTKWASRSAMAWLASTMPTASGPLVTPNRGARTPITGMVSAL